MIVAWHDIGVASCRTSVGTRDEKLVLKTRFYRVSKKL